MNEIEQALIYYDGNGDMPYCDLVYEALKRMLNEERAKQNENPDSV